MNKLVILLLLLFISGCATTSGTDSGSLRESTVAQRPPEKPRYAEPSAPKPRPEEARTTSAETWTRPEFPAVQRQTEPQPTIARVTPQEPKDLSTTRIRQPEHHAEGLSGLSRLAEANDEKLIKIFVGMDRATVESIMSSPRNPAKRERITGGAGQLYEVLFFLTREPRKGKPITERLMTPVILRNNEVVAIGNFHLKKLRTTGSVERKKRQASKPKE